MTLRLNRIDNQSSMRPRLHASCVNESFTMHSGHSGIRGCQRTSLRDALCNLHSPQLEKCRKTLSGLTPVISTQSRSPVESGNILFIKCHFRAKVILTCREGFIWLSHPAASGSQERPQSDHDGWMGQQLVVCFPFPSMLCCFKGVLDPRFLSLIPRTQNTDALGWQPALLTKPLPGKLNLEAWARYLPDFLILEMLITPWNNGSSLLALSYLYGSPSCQTPTHVHWCILPPLPDVNSARRSRPVRAGSANRRTC